jgi:hypothetical protein
MRLIVVHHHYRPGGVRRVIETGLPHVLHAIGEGRHRVTLAGGETADASWVALVERRIRPSSVEVFEDPMLGYVAEWKSRLRRMDSRRMEARLEELLGTGLDGDTVVWAHNLGLGRNVYLTEALPRICASRGDPDGGAPSRLVV